MNGKVKFGMKDDIQVLLVGTISDSIVIECDWWIQICIRFTRKDFICLFLRIRIKLQFPLVGPRL